VRTPAKVIGRLVEAIPGQGVRDLIVVGLAVAVAAQHARHFLTITEPLLVAMFAIAWARAGVRRVSELRRGTYVPWSTLAGNRREVWCLLAVGAGPWFALPVLHQLYGTSFLLTPVPLPISVRVVAACVAMALSLFEFPRLRVRADRRQLSPVSDALSESPLLVLAMVIVSASPFVALLGTTWLVMARIFAVPYTPARAVDNEAAAAWLTVNYESSAPSR
jgi:hypothetical protein